MRHAESKVPVTRVRSGRRLVVGIVEFLYTSALLNAVERRESIRIVADIDEVLAGSLGFFIPKATTGPEPASQGRVAGYVHIDGRYAVIDTLVERPADDWLTSTAPAPSSIAAIMPEDSALFLEVQGPSPTTRFGGLRASTHRYRSRTVVGAAPIDGLRSDWLMSLTAEFAEIGRWAGISTTREEHEKYADGRLKSWSMSLEDSFEPRTCVLGRGRELVLSTTWRVDGPVDGRKIWAPVTIGCRSSRPRTAWDLVEPLLRVQDLLSLAFDGFVAASGAGAELDLPPSDDHVVRACTCWNGSLMVRGPGATPPNSMTEFPLFYLETVGGLPGLARWISLYDRYPGIPRTVVDRYRLGANSPEVHLTQVASGIERWVKAHRPAHWATAHKYASALVTHLGRLCADWIGDPQGWSKEFWEANDSLKHESKRVDPWRMNDLATCGQLMLAAALLDQVAGSRTPSRSIFQHHRAVHLGMRMRESFGIHTN